MLELQAHPISSTAESKVKVSFKFLPEHLSVEFEVTSSKLHTDNRFSTESWDNWGLWDNDVVEVFLKRSEGCRDYLELQVSPLNQKFALLIKKPREEFQKASPQHTEVFSMRTDDGFRAQFKISYLDIPGEGSEILGNFHACLGSPDRREYFSYKLNQGDTPDFHRPEYFQKLGTLP